MAKYKRIMCPVAFDANSAVAVEIAAETAKENDATLFLLHVAHIPPQDMDAPLPFENNPRWESEARAKLEALGREKLAGLTYQIKVISGIADTQIVPAADELNADLIVMATHGRSGLGHFILGSVTENVIREANCPVLVISPRVRLRSRQPQ